ncbi:stAR-related lipid transfer protein 7, mitochondrial-like isoform X1 [Spodoptera litura]|uniref:StAR-related lipid transfer protein 7, mitochondrial-like isoform X1 n=2 Tax=Spodoptera litura TaxID=69820 RepID=A0A9J7DV42_SPOLT|nr:stAR-related lipid transfer protein 7, mitochondrial-like isoform X1 [Spodoptera litura]
MLCSKLKQIVLPQQALNNNVQFRYFVTSRYLFKQWIWYDGLLANLGKKEVGRMSALRFILRDFRVWSAWTRCNIVSTVVKRCRRDRSVREVIQRFKQTFFRPRRTLLISATAAYKARDGDNDDDTPVSCDKNITDEELQALLSELEGVETLSRNTLFCTGCGKRLVIEKKQPGVPYCSCKVSALPAESPDGWVPYMEAEDVIIWRKEYKPGMGLYAYKVYGRYLDVRASDFAAVQVDGAYRTVWDAAVAALAVVERKANGLADQAVLHWEVLWPRLFANRDYVYIRRHKEFDVSTENLPHKDGLFRASQRSTRNETVYTERPSVHSKAKRKAMEACKRERDGDMCENKVYVIMSRSCEHPKVPESKHAIRVSEYWSHMVVKTLNGPDKAGMEFVLTYYDEPAVGGMPTTVAAWATGRAAPAYLQRMRRAACDYRAWRRDKQQEDLPEFIPFAKDSEPCEEDSSGIVNEEDMESSQTGPELERSECTRDQSTQTDVVATLPHQPEVKVTQLSGKGKENVDTDLKDVLNDTQPLTSEPETPKEEEEPKTGGWWRYLYPFYYFV